MPQYKDDSGTGRMAEAAVKIRDRMWAGVLRVAAPQKSDSDVLRGDALQTRRGAVGVQLWARGKGRSTIRCCFFAGTRAPKNTAVGWGVASLSQRSISIVVTRVHIRGLLW